MRATIGILCLLALTACTRFVSDAPADGDGPRDMGASEAAGDARVDLAADVRSLDLPDLADLPVPPDLLALQDIGLPDLPDIGLPDLPDIGLPDLPDSGAIDGTFPTQLCGWTNPTILAVDAVASVNSPSREQDPFLTADGKTLYFSSERTGKGDIYVATRAGAGSSFGTPVALANVNTGDSEYRFEVFDNGQRALLNTNRSGGAGDFDIYEGVLAPFGGAYTWTLASVSTTGREFDSHITRGGLEIFFSPVVTGQSSIWMAKRGGLSDPFGQAKLVFADAAGATLSRDGTVLVLTNCPAGSSCDIYFSLRTPGTDTFSVPTKLPGTLVNTGAFEAEPFISADGCELFFARGTASNNWDLFRAELGP